MTTLMIPSLVQRLLQTVSEEVAAEPVHEWPASSLRMCLDLVKNIRLNAVGNRQMLEKWLSEGVEARSFARAGSSVLSASDVQLTLIRQLTERLATSEDDASRSLAAEVRLLDQEAQAFRNLLDEALSRASEAPRPIDRARARSAEEAHARGETKPFSQR